MAFKQIVTELLWFLRGDTSIEYLLKNDCNIWTGDAYKNYEKWWKSYSPGGAPIPLSREMFIDRIKTDDEFANKWGELGPVYGHQWRNWGEWSTIGVPKKVLKPGIDQIANLISELKTNPDSRRLMVNAWNVGELDSMVLPPCHYGFQVYTRELSLEERVKYYETTFGRLHFIPPTIDLLNKENIPTRAISLMWNQRSVDTGLGLSFNVSSYSLLLMMIAKQVNMIPDEVIGNLGDVHLYLNHIEPIKEQLTREPYPLPIVKISDRVVGDISEYTLDDITLENYKCHPTIKMSLSN
jgi:thymidylate synthase